MEHMKEDFPSQMTRTDKVLPLWEQAELSVVSLLESDLETRTSFMEGPLECVVDCLSSLGKQGQERSQISATANPHSSGLSRVQTEQGGHEKKQIHSVKDPPLLDQSDLAKEVSKEFDGETNEVNPGTDGPPQRQNSGESGHTDANEEECPICTEPFGSLGGHRRALLNCDHTVCQGCLADMLKRAADSTRVCCPLCRQKTPLLDWEIRRMQEEAACHMGGGVTLFLPLNQPAASLPPLTPGPCPALERRLESRVEAGLVCGCFRFPNGLARVLRQLQRRCRCCYLTCLLLLYLAELSCLLLVFLPVLVLVLLFTLAGK